MESILNHPIYKWIENRRLYSYIPGRLVISRSQASDFTWDELSLNCFIPDTKNISNWGKSTDLDSYHHKLLHSPNDIDILTGFLSIIFWGYVSGADGVVRKARALSKVRAFRDGNGQQSPTSKEELLHRLRSARSLAASNRFGDALGELMNVKYLGMSFSSKIIMFINPDKAAVYDSIIADRIKRDPNLEFLYTKTTGSTPKDKTIQMSTYEMWCNFCSQSADLLCLRESAWNDWDGESYPFRAVDIERSFFALGRN